MDAFAKPETGFKGLDFRINQSLKMYGYHNLMGYITGNQDRARFMSYADGSIRFDEDAKLAGWTREIKVKDEIAYNRMEQLIALMMTIPGCPVIFYGDE
ncbi:MAG TPA: alpha-amlyase, partial [Bacteroidales bacterium]|nr:alpha-amlyase [Bacteroidales bacterium]